MYCNADVTVKNFLLKRVAHATPQVEGRVCRESAGKRELDAGASYTETKMAVVQTARESCDLRRILARGHHTVCNSILQVKLQ